MLPVKYESLNLFLRFRFELKAEKTPAFSFNMPDKKENENSGLHNWFCCINHNKNNQK